MLSSHQDYLLVVHHPIDLGTVRANLLAGEYAVPNDFILDVRLIFENAKAYNRRGSEVSIKICWE